MKLYIKYFCVILLPLALYSCDPVSMNAFLMGFARGMATSEGAYDTSIGYGWNNFYLLEGTLIIARDGQFLGVITSNKFDSDSIINEYGKYGNQYSSVSIFNKYGEYGSQYSSFSPFNKYTSTPPQIHNRQGEFIAYLTVNKILIPRIDPFFLIAWLKSNN